MAIITLNNNSLSSVTSLPAAISTGKVLQVVSGTDNTTRSASSSNFSHGNSTAIATLTPSSSSNKIVVIASTTTERGGSGVATFSVFRDNSTNLATNYFYRNGHTGGGEHFCGVYLDSPNTTSEINYRIKFTNSTGSTTYIGHDNGLTSVVAMEIEG